jgi:hypothetical protein
MSIDNAMDRLRAANPAPDKRLLRAELDDLNVVLSATWQRSTNVQTELPQQTQPSQKPSRRGWLVAAAAFAVVVIVGFGASLIATDNNNAPAVPGAETAPVSVVVPGTEQWTDTGIDLSIDDTVLIEADGAVTPSETSSVIPVNDPDGNTDPAARHFNVEGLEEANHAALIGRIGEDGAPFQVGSQLLTEVDTEGRLFLGINDSGVGNNAGEFTATITVNSS